VTLPVTLNTDSAVRVSCARRVHERSVEVLAAALRRRLRSTNGRVIPVTAKVGASLQITFSSPVSEACRQIISCHSRSNYANTAGYRPPEPLKFFNLISIAGLQTAPYPLPITSVLLIAAI
jgi:hypothetical protein